MKNVKVGDRVRVISGEKTGPAYTVNYGMKKLIGFIGTVEYIKPDEKSIGIKHPNGDLTWQWHIDDLEMHNPAQ